MFQTNSNHQLHKEAVDLVVANLPGAINMDSLAGYDASYHVDWNGLKLVLRISRPTRKLSQPKAKWFFTPRDNDRSKADYFILMCLVGSNLEAVYAVPRVFLPKVYITITRLNGNMRYSYFRTTIESLGKKIMDIQAKLPQLIKISKGG